ncbi:MAG: hypothetical protein K2G40_08700, partial [Muribaculaceae bacterium]|nr:hypothetical protein [Muribaculaceae bacterium]
DSSEIAYITSDSIGQSDSISDTIIAESLTSIPVQPSPADIENTRNNTYDIANSNLSNENQIVTDTVSATNFLATMSRKYFGRMEFWVYIYLENKDKLQDPDHVPAGTVVVIPSRSKYGIDPDSPESIEKAKAMTAEVYKP